MTKTVLAAALMVFAVQANAETFKVDTAKSTIAWKATKKVMGGHNGKVSIKEGQVDVDAKKNEVTGLKVVADMKTITAEDLAADAGTQKKFLGHVSSADFFDVAKYPTAEFKLDKIAKKGNETVASGQLTFIGQTKPVEFPVTFKIDKGVATGSGKLQVDRTKWGLKYGSGNFFKELAADKIINDNFELDINIVASK